MELTAVDHRIPLSDGNSIPIIGYGTYPTPPMTPKGSCRAGVKLAIDVGYRYIDGAYSYQNEKEVGEAIREKIAEGRVKREDIFYSGKLWGTDFDPQRVLPALQKTLQDVHLDYVDLYIMETPMAFKPGDEIFPKDKKGNWIFHKTNLCATWEALEACKDAGLVKSLGVSNFNRRQLELILNKPRLKYKPVCNQVQSDKRVGCAKEFQELLNIKDHGLGVYFEPLLEDELLNSLGKKYNKTAAQVALRFNIQRGTVVIPKSYDPTMIKENLQIFDFSLTTEEMKTIETLNRDVRLAGQLRFSGHPEYPFHDEY
ncbi:3-oxo-5-beta-steroid 4-dehydrogenase-like [Myotis lucifugus]|uniref:3-oxo-5-beta-steroid 4-dehydrogenase-like n=1 Tax=Myotis lucifugus TaxID=59463 RepID=UPI0003C4306F|nr:3-oxo-5-beta-steroid 4-dehydrogenase-like [Myotis lucifugus]